MLLFCCFLHLFVAVTFGADENLYGKQITESIAAEKAPARPRWLWKPQVGSKFQIVLSGIVVIDSKSTLVPEHVDIWDIDLFDTDRATIELFKARGKKIICYFSAGTSEAWRPDFKKFQAKDQGANLPLWPGERWLDIRKRAVFNIMKKRIQYASRKGCDAIDPDNMDGYSNEKGGGFARPLRQRDTIRYVKKLSREARRHKMSMGLKNAEEVIPRVTRDVHFAVNEECGMDNEEPCKAYKRILKGKPVYHIEYVEPRLASYDTLNKTQTSSATNAWEISNSAFRNMSSTTLRRRLCLEADPSMSLKMSTVIKQLSLDGWIMHCNGMTVVTETRPSEENKRRNILAMDPDPEYLQIMAEPDEIEDADDAAFDAAIDEELADFEESMGTGKGAAKDKRPSPEWIQLHSKPGLEAASGES